MQINYLKICKVHIDKMIIAANIQKRFNPTKIAGLLFLKL